MAHEPKGKKREFNFFRYQILPKIDPTIPQIFYQTPDRTYASVEELRADKNRIFAKALKGIQNFRWPFGSITHQIVYEHGEFSLLRLAVNRPVKLRTQDFATKYSDDWPWTYVFFDNNPQVQIIAIEINKEAWDHTDTTARMFRRNLNHVLHRYSLFVEIEALTEKRAFWDLIDKYRGKISKIEFDMVSPNMSNIATKVEWPLREIRDRYNASRQKLILENRTGGALDVKHDSLITSLADHGAEGGGTTRVKVRGFRMTKSVSDDKITLEMDDLEIQADRPTHFVEMATEIEKLIEEATK